MVHRIRFLFLLRPGVKRAIRSGFEGVPGLSPRSLEKPKSHIFMQSSPVIMRLAGFMSLWTMPARRRRASPQEVDGSNGLSCQG